MIPDYIGRYEVQCLLGEGAFGQVYAARDPLLKRVVAIKVLRANFVNDESFMERFRGEASSLASLAHPNITLIYDLLEDGSQSGMVMEFVRGHTLEHILKLKKKLTPEQTLAIATQVGAGMGYIHRRNVVHRDIKPSNIMLTADGVVKIMDFGIARVQGSKRLTRDGSVVGTLAYCAPEQIKTGEGEPRSDQYSFACVVYEMLTGNLPVEAETEYGLMQAHITQRPTPLSEALPGVPAQIDQAVQRALSKSAADRFESMPAFASAMGADAVAAQATDIVRDLVMSSDAIPEIPMRAAGPRRSSQPSGQTVAMFSLGNAGTGQVGLPTGNTRTGGGRSKAPLMVMGAAVVLALGVGAYVLLDERSTATASTAKPPAPQTAQVQPPPVPEPPKAPELTPPKPAPVERPAPPTQQQADAKPPPPPANMPELPQHPGPPQKKIDPGTGDGTRMTMEQQKSMPDFGKPDAPLTGAQACAEPPKVVMPTDTPAYKGRALSWPGGGTVMVRARTGNGPEFLRLFGVNDLASNKQSVVDATRDKLEAFFVKYGRETTCWNRFGGTTGVRYLCFVDNRDLARWAIDCGLGESAAGSGYDKR